VTDHCNGSKYHPSVAVNGEEVPELKGRGRTDLPSGWYSEGSRSVVRLPYGPVRMLAIKLRQAGSACGTQMPPPQVPEPPWRVAAPR